MSNQPDQDVVDVVETYVRGVTTADAPTVASAFSDDAHMWGYLGDEYVSVPISGFLEVVATGPDPAKWIEDYHHVIRDVEVAGDVARAVLDETGYAGANFTNYFTLVRASERWRIVSKTFMLNA